MKENNPFTSGVSAIESRLAANQRRHHNFPLQQASLVRLIKHLYKLFNDEANTLLREYGLTYPEYSVLILLDGNEQGFGPGELAEIISEKSSNITRLVDQLIAKGLVTRIASVQDRRRLLIYITEAGEQLIEQVLPVVKVQLQGFLSNLDDIESGQLDRLLRKVISGVEGHHL